MIALFLLNLFLALVYVVLTEDGSFFNLLIGFVIGYLIVTLVARVHGGGAPYSRRWLKVVRFLGWFLLILIKANWTVAREIITPGFSMSPRLVRYNVKDLTAAQITTLCITLTPGTLSVDVDEDGHELLIHFMYGADIDRAKADIDDLRRRMLHGIFGQ